MPQYIIVFTPYMMPSNLDLPSFWSKVPTKVTGTQDGLYEFGYFRCFMYLRTITINIIVKVVPFKPISLSNGELLIDSLAILIKILVDMGFRLKFSF